MAPLGPDPRGPNMDSHALTSVARILQLSCPETYLNLGSNFLKELQFCCNICRLSSNTGARPCACRCYIRHLQSCYDISCQLISGMIRWWWLSCPEMLMQFQLFSTLVFQIELLIPDVRFSDLEFSSVLTQIDWAEVLPDDMIRELF